MSITVKVDDYELLPSGSYDAVVGDVEEAESNGTYWKWSFEVVHDGETRHVTAASSRNFGRRAKARGWVEAILGRQLDRGDEFTSDTIAGKSCVLEIGTDDTGEYNRVKDVLHGAPKPDNADAPL